MGLERYRERRDFARTQEPRGGRRRTGRGRLFVVQMHDARRLHYDFRLEEDGVLKSWAVPKGPSLDPADKRLAVETEDHPLDYGDFEGIIPAGEYGAGPVLLWDRGTWEPAGDVAAGLRKGHLKFHLEGEKLRGNWVLVRRGDEGNWLLIKERDDAAAEGVDILGQEPRSVKSGQSIGDVGPKQQPKGERARKRGSGQRTPGSRDGDGDSATAASQESAQPAGLENVRRAAMPGSMRPELATPVESIAEGDEWLHEVKYDGYRLLCHIRDGRARLLSRNGKDWTERLPAVARAAEKLGIEAAILDGELVALRQDGTSDFQALQNALKGGGREHLVYYVFDLPFLGDYDLRHAPLDQRKQALRGLLDRAPEQPVVRYTDHARGQGPELFAEACRRRLEGLISKRADSPYTSRRTRDWQKTKCGQRQEFVIGGFTDPTGSRQGFGSLLLGYREGEGLRYAGRVGTGFSDEQLRELTERLRALEQDHPAFGDAPTERPGGRRVHWIRPELVAEIRFAEWTGDGRLRQPSFLGLREDKAVNEVSRERPARPAPSHRNAGRGGKAQTKTVCGVRLTHPDRVLYPEQGITKAQLADYYASVAEWMLPHVAGRPLSLVRCPQGHSGQCFYQKHLQEGAPESLSTVEIPEKKQRVPYGVVEGEAGLVALAQMGVLEVHPWGARADQPERPDRVVFDLDPGEGVGWSTVVGAARELHGRLEELGLTAFAKTTGGKGLHLVLPLRRGHDWDAVKEFTGAVARQLAAESPDRYVATMSKSRRQGRVFIDYLRNGRGATAIAPYSTRARAGAPIAVPIRWEELGRLRDPRKYTLQNLPARLKRLREPPWEGFFEIRQSITRAMRRRVGL